jgi:hypothetical protein
MTPNVNDKVRSKGLASIPASLIRWYESDPLHSFFGKVVIPLLSALLWGFDYAFCGESLLCTYLGLVNMTGVLGRCLATELEKIVTSGF